MGLVSSVHPIILGEEPAGFFWGGLPHCKRGTSQGHAISTSEHCCLHGTLQMAVALLKPGGSPPKGIKEAGGTLSLVALLNNWTKQPRPLSSQSSFLVGLDADKHMH